MNPDEPISMYVPARNAERCLAACVDSIRNQSRPPDELFIVVDPRSSDRTLDVARQLGPPVVEQTGSTLGSARNQAIQMARHHWLASCDSDVTLESDWLARLAEGRSTGAAGVGGRTLENARSPFDEWRALQMPHHWGEHPFRNPFMLVSEVLFDRNALLAVGGYRDDLNYYEDSDLCQRLRDGGFDLFYQPAAVAHHQRRDDLLSVLGLRWKYSEYRQRHLLDRYGDLLRKLAANREYALSTLSRLLARGREDLSYISFLLFFHHLLADIHSLHARRPLLARERRTAIEAAWLDTALAALAEQSAALTASVGQDLAGVPSQWNTETDVGASIDLPCWPASLDNLRRAVTAFCDELPDAIFDILESSSRYLHQELSGGDVRRLPRPADDDLRQALAAMPVQPFADTALREQILRQWPGPLRLHLLGLATAAETSDLTANAGPATAASPICVFLHLEARPDPLTAFHEPVPECHYCVACYQPPARFVAGLDVCSASDLASAAAAAGWSIDRFDTIIGRTRLMLSR